MNLKRPFKFATIDYFPELLHIVDVSKNPPQMISLAHADVDFDFQIKRFNFWRSVNSPVSKRICSSCRHQYRKIKNPRE